MGRHSATTPSLVLTHHHSRRRVAMRPRTRRFGALLLQTILIASALCVPSVLLSTDSIQWKSIGPGGGGNSLAVGVSPADPNIVLMGSDVGGIFRTADGGQT